MDRSIRRRRACAHPPRFVGAAEGHTGRPPSPRGSQPGAASASLVGQSRCAEGLRQQGRLLDLDGAVALDMAQHGVGPVLVQTSDGASTAVMTLAGTAVVPSTGRPRGTPAHDRSERRASSGAEPGAAAWTTRPQRPAWRYGIGTTSTNSCMLLWVRAMRWSPNWMPCYARWSRQPLAGLSPSWWAPSTSRGEVRRSRSLARSRCACNPGQDGPHATQGMATGRAVYVRELLTKAADAMRLVTEESEERHGELEADGLLDHVIQHASLAAVVVQDLQTRRGKVRPRAPVATHLPRRWSTVADVLTRDSSAAAVSSVTDPGLCVRLGADVRLARRHWTVPSVRTRPLAQVSTPCAVRRARLRGRETSTPTLCCARAGTGNGLLGSRGGNVEL